jgi:hypothetical protein
MLADLYRRYQKYAALCCFAGGILYDSLTLGRIDRLLDNLVLLAYLILLGGLITLIGWLHTGQVSHPRLRRYREFYPLAVQFLLGSLFSAYAVFYFQSVSLTRTAVFFGLIVGLLLANELLRERLTSLPLLAGMYTFALFSFFIFFVPVLLAAMNRWTFALGAGLSGLALAGVLVAIFLRAPDRAGLVPCGLAGGGVLAVLLLLYWANWIPPVPLALRSGGIYHRAEKTGTRYRVEMVKPPRYLFWKKSEEVFYLRPGDRAYCFTAVFAPAELRTTLFHQWQRYDEKKGEWVQTDRMSYPVSGGREGGYRGFTYKQALSPGEWRVDVENPEGQLLGRLAFRVEEAGGRKLEFVSLER